MIVEEDSYLVYLVRTNHEEALEYLLKKYRVICMRLLEIHFVSYEYKLELVDDFLCTFRSVIDKFDDSKGIFYSYVTLSARRFFLRRLYREASEVNKLNNYGFEMCRQRLYLYDSELPRNELIDYLEPLLNAEEFEVLIRTICYNQGAQTIAKKMNLSVKRVYNINLKIKEISKNYF